MGEDAEVRKRLIDRFKLLQKSMCQISESSVPSDYRYMDRFVDSLRELRFGCVTESFRPTRVPSCVRCPDRYIGVCRMELLDMDCGLTIRFECRSVGYDRTEVEKSTFEGVFDSAGLTVRGREKEFRCMDIGSAEYSKMAKGLTPETPYMAY